MRAELVAPLSGVPIPVAPRKPEDVVQSEQGSSGWRWPSCGAGRALRGLRGPKQDWGGWGLWSDGLLQPQGLRASVREGGKRVFPGKKCRF